MSNLEVALRAFMAPFAFFILSFCVMLFCWIMWRLFPRTAFGQLCASFVLKGPAPPPEDPSRRL